MARNIQEKISDRLLLLYLLDNAWKVGKIEGVPNKEPISRQFSSVLQSPKNGINSRTGRKAWRLWALAME